MTTPVSEIIDILKQQADLYDTMLGLEKEKTPAIIRNDMNELNAITAKERKWTIEAQRLEQERLRLTAGIVVQNGLSRVRAGVLSNLIKVVTDAKEKQELTELHHRLRETLQELKLVNENNKQMMEMSLDFIRFSLDLLVEDPNENVVYQHPLNRTAPGPGMGIFNKRY
ncbi:flagellar protein FlgN [Paenibacillus protaetiae]|uniref:Flagellar protein FlgN n=1 Tax=Paenibacillus protaetiae TaxID=2509456 RepID=A0A4V0YFH7_9BACL|nr:flagellar protein FlgN [Paenibacillus protaetiae]QAY67751.1 flagellar protein FlgN [Paenibacillus protaetiae]